jgi:drug/metabolite transporter (DMT)-like permease
MKIQPAHWALLLVLVALWGSSYLMVEVALQVWLPEQVTGLRILAAAVVLLAAMLVRGQRFPRGWAPWAYFFGIAVVGNCLPFFLISWGQQQVDSGLAGILAATTPLAVLILAHFMLADERLSPRHGLAFVFGFCGIIVLMGPESLAALGGSSNRWLSQLAILGGAVCYAVATVMARRMPSMSPLVTSAGVMVCGSAVMSPFTMSGVRLLPNVAWQPGLAIGFLGLLGTGLASILYFRLVAETGARFTSLLNYLVPVWAVVLGAVVLEESVPLRSLLALALILVGLILTSGSAKKLTGSLD